MAYKEVIKDILCGIESGEIDVEGGDFCIVLWRHGVMQEYRPYLIASKDEFTLQEAFTRVVGFLDEEREIQVKGGDTGVARDMVRIKDSDG